LTYWPFVQSNLTDTCMQQVMAISRLNIDKSYGMQLTLTMTTMLMAIVAVFIN